MKIKQLNSHSLIKLYRLASMSQHTDFNEDMTNESASMACSNVLKWNS